MKSDEKKELEDLLRPYGQESVLRFWDTLTPESRRKLAAEVRSIEWSRVMDWAENGAKELTAAEKSAMAPAPYKPLKPETPGESALYARAIKTGKALLSSSAVAAFTVAGGQGTRLGYNAPKGTFPFTEIRAKSLFQVFAEDILHTEHQYACHIKWYIMTSIANHADTRNFFAKHAYFGLSPEQVMFFSQDMLPTFDLKTGAALLAAPDSLALTPNGHGGSLKALLDSGALADMRGRGITTITYWQVDNPLIRPFDPLFLGLHELTGSEMSCRALIKRDPMEKLGHFCIHNGKCCVIEYSDMPAELLTMKDEDGRLRFRAGSPAIHVISRAFIERITKGQLDIPAHIAHKKVKCLDKDGNPFTPAQPNARKLEFFIFDALPLATNPLILEGDRAEEFAPVKNAAGDDSPESSRAAMNARNARWFEAAGLLFPRKPDGTPAAVVELSPLTFGGPEDLAAKADSLPHIKPGDFIYLE